MKTLILSCNTGAGHNSCASAIQEMYHEHGTECEILDALSFISEEASELISEWHVRIYRHMPEAFGLGYRMAEKHPLPVEETLLLDKVLTQGAERMAETIVAEKYGCVICTHVFAAIMLTKILRSYHPAIATAFLATDYTCSPFVKETDLGVYFLPDERLCEEFLCENIPEEKMVFSGIPVRQMFYEERDGEKSRRKFRVQPDTVHIVIAGGSMGCGPVERLCEELCPDLCEDVEVTVVCGSNKKLRRTLCQSFAGYENVHIAGFVKDMASLLRSADIYVTKPGGISTTEAAVMRLPQVYFDAVSGCEYYNLVFFTEAGVAKSEDGVRELTELILSLSADPAERAAMKAAYERLPEQNSAEVIYETMERAAKNYTR